MNTEVVPREQDGGVKKSPREANILSTDISHHTSLDQTESSVVLGSTVQDDTLSKNDNEYIDVKDEDELPCSRELYVEILSRNIPAIRKLAEERTDVLHKGKNGSTALHLAAAVGVFDAIPLLLEGGADISCQDNNGNTALHDAVSGGVFGATPPVLGGADILCQDNNGRTTLHDPATVSQNCHLTISKLLERGANIACRDKYGRTALHKAVARGDYSIVSLLVKKGADILCKDNHGRVPLHSASFRDHPNTLENLKDVSLILRDQGRFGEAEEVCWRVVGGYGRLLGPDHRDTIASFNVLGLILQDQGKFSSAESVCRQALEGYEKLLGPDHRDTLASLNDLSSILRDKGELREAEEVCRGALGGYDKLLGPGHCGTLASLNDLSLILRDKGDLREAENVCRRALEGYEKLLGLGHRDALASLNGLGSILRDKRELHGAEGVCRRALEGYEKLLGPDHRDTLASLNNLSLILRDKRELRGAKEVCRRALEGYEKLLGPDHRDTLASLNNLSLILRDKGELCEAVNVCRRALEGYEKLLGPDHRDTLASLNNLGLIFRDDGDLREAEWYEKLLGLDHRDTLASLNNLGAIQDWRLSGAWKGSLWIRRLSGVWQEPTRNRRFSRQILFRGQAWRRKASVLNMPDHPAEADAPMASLGPTTQTGANSGGLSPSDSPSSRGITTEGNEDGDGRVEGSNGEANAVSGGDSSYHNRSQLFNLSSGSSDSGNNRVCGENGKWKTNRKGDGDIPLKSPTRNAPSMKQAGDDDQSDGKSLGSVTQCDTMSSDTLASGSTRGISPSSTEHTMLELDHESGGEGEEGDNEDDSGVDNTDDEMDTSSEGENSCFSLGISSSVVDAGSFRSRGGGGGRGGGEGQRDISRKRSAPQSLAGHPKDGKQGDCGSSSSPFKRQKKDERGQSKSPGHSKRPFACPYFKKDPLEYLDCVEWCNIKLNSVKGHCVSQHLKLRCPRCKIFRAGIQDQINKHLDDEDCKKSEHDDSAEEAADKKKVQDLNKARTWEKIYEVLFPLYIPDPFWQNQLEALMAPIGDDEWTSKNYYAVVPPSSKRAYRLGLAEFLKDRLELRRGAADELLVEYDKHWMLNNCSLALTPDDTGGTEVGPQVNGAAICDPSSRAQQFNALEAVDDPTTSQHCSEPLLEITGRDQHYQQSAADNNPTQSHEAQKSIGFRIPSQGHASLQIDSWESLLSDLEPQQDECGEEAYTKDPIGIFGDLLSIDIFEPGKISDVGEGSAQMGG